MNQCEELLKLLMEAIRQDEQKREKTKMDGSIPVGVLTVMFIYLRRIWISCLALDTI